MAVLKPIPLHKGTIKDIIPAWLDSLLLWLGYFNSALNPIIYARFNREFRRPFIEILCFRCFGINEKLRDEERKKMYTDVNSHNSNNSHNYKESPNYISTSALNSHFINNKNPKKLNYNNSNECLAKFDIKNEKNENFLIKSEELESNYINSDMLNKDIKNEDLELNSKIVNQDEISTQHNVNNSQKNLNQTNENNLTKKYKLNELISFRFYNLTIIDGIQPSFDKPVLSLRIKIPKNLSNKKDESKRKRKKEYITNLTEKKNIDLNSDLKNQLLLTNKSIKILKHQSLTLNDYNSYNNKKNINFKRMKQSASTDEFKSITKNKIRTKTLTATDISRNFLI